MKSKCFIMPPQLKTLIPLFAIFIVLFLIGRHLVVPESFGKEGHYRFNSVAENAELSCETCHGPGFAHYEDPDSSRLIVPESREFCGLCHQRNYIREKKLTQIWKIKPGFN